MPLITYRVGKTLNRWAILHHDQPLATFDTQAEAERVALKLATHHPTGDSAQVDTPQPDGKVKGIRVF